MEPNQYYSMKKILAPILFLVTFVVLTSQASALRIENITFIPDRNHISAGAPFIAMANVDQNQSVRVMWSAPEGEMAEYHHGLFPLIKGKFFCFFSEEKENTCGPPIFTQSGTYNFNVKAINHQGQIDQVNRTKVPVGGIKMDVVRVIENRTLYLTVHPYKAVNYVKYDVYDDQLKKKKTGEMERARFGFVQNITFPPGNHYVALYTKSKNDTGGQVFPVSVGAVSPNRTEYNLIDADEISISGLLLEKNEHYEQRNFHMTNLADRTLANLSVRVPANISPYLNVSLQKASLSPGESSYFTVMLDNIDTPMGIRSEAYFLSNSNRVGKTDVKIDVSIKGREPSAEPLVEISNPIWEEEALVETISKTFTLNNKADSALKSITYSASSGIKDIVTVDLPSSVSPQSAADINITLSPTSSGKNTGIVTIETDAGQAQLFVNVHFYDDITGEIDSAQNELDIFVQGLSAKQQAQLSGLTESISTELQSAKSKLEFGSYSLAQDKLDSAQDKLSTLKDAVGVSPTSGYCGDGTCGPGESAMDCPEDCGQEDNETRSPAGQPPGGSDWVGITLIIIIIVVVAVGAWFYFTRMREAKGWEEEIEEEY